MVASTLALVCGAAAAMVIAVLLRDRVGPRVAFAAVLVYATFVASPILQVAYTESLAMLLLAAFLLALSRERWLVASALALGIGVTRPIAVPLGVVALVAVVRALAPPLRAPAGTRRGVLDGHRAGRLRGGGAGLAGHRLVADRGPLGLHRHDGDLAREPVR